MNKQSMMSIGMLVVLVLLMYILLIRPQKKKEKEVAAMRSALQAGDEIITIGGIHGKVIRVKDDSIILAVGPEKTKIEVTKWAISQVTKSRADKDKEPVAKPKQLKKSTEEVKDEVVDVEVEEIATEVEAEE